MNTIQNKTTRFLWGSLISVILLCVCVFSFLAFHMGSVSSRTVNEVGSLYMSSMSEQLSLHFETTINLNLEQMEALSGIMAPDRIHEDPEQQALLASYAKALDFQYLGFYTRQNDFEMLYGSHLTVTDPGPFMDSLSAGQKKVAVGEDAQGNSVILMGVPSSHALSQEHSCVALVGAMPVDYITQTLSLEENSNHEYSHIIRIDGSFVIRTSDASRDNYFDRVLSLYDNVGGKTPQEYIADLSAAMKAGEDYSSEFTIGGERRHLHCTRLANSEWYLITFMPYNTMGSILNHLNRQWVGSALLGASLILAAILLVFAGYFRMTRRQMEELARAWHDADAATKAKSEFLSNMSHDIRTPMNAIVGMTAIATANLDDRDQVQNCLKKITLSSKHLLGLINDVLDMSKIESGKMTLSLDQISLREVMESVVSIVQPQIRIKNQKFHVSIHDISTENVYCDSVRLNQVLLNLLSNAIKFTPEGGSVTVALWEEPSPKGEEHIRIHLSVSDTGIGMTPEFKERIFESFSREDSARVHRTEGTGLGMAITKYIVDAMEGSIAVDSTPGQGTRFQITLDLEKADISEPEMILPNWNMLVVDDDQLLCESAAASLQSMGFRADWCQDGESALQRILQRREQKDPYQIILLDWKLPGIDGVETARRIRHTLGSEVPILLISAYDWGEIETQAKTAGISGFISKPLFKSTLYHCLKQYADHPQAQIPDPSQLTPDLSGKRVLLAEDNELNWEIANELLSGLGLTLDWAENGRLCLDMFQDSEPGYYDAILMDIRMPVMTGYEAARAIRALDRPDAGLPIIAMTADAFAEDVKKALDAGMDSHIAKPIDVREVSRLLKRFMRD